MTYSRKGLSCPYADHSINVSNSGFIGTCCWAQPVKDSTGNIFNIKTHTITEAYNSVEFQEIRNNLHLGVQDPHCVNCWHVEDLGGKSIRTEELDNEIDAYTDVVGLHILSLDLSNHCNLKCRTCNPDDSSLWVKEYHDVYGHKPVKNNNNLQHEHKFYEDLKTNVLPLTKEIHFKGGEPMLLKRQWELVDHMIQSDIAQQKVISYHTNATIWNDTIEEKLRNFETVGVGCSIDDVGHRFEYLRHPAKWNQVEYNLDKIKKWTGEKDNGYMAINVVVSVYNVLTIDELINYFYQKDITLYLHPTISPSHFDIKNLPDYIKKIVTDRLSKNSWSEEYDREVENLITMMNVDHGDIGSWDRFINYTKTHDTYRNESLEKTFPELWQLIDRAGIQQV